MRRSWLAHATSSRLASKTSCTCSAISLNDRASAGELLRAVLARAHGEVAGCDLRGGGAEAPDRPGEVAGEQQCGEQRRRGGSDGDGEQLDVVPHVEHHPAGEEDDGERQRDGQERQGDELAADRRQEADPDDERQPDRKGQGGEAEPGSDHGTSL